MSLDHNNTNHNSNIQSETSNSQQHSFKDQQMKKLEDLKFAYTTDKITNGNSLNSPISFDTMIDLITGDKMPSIYPKIAKSVIECLESGGDIKALKKDRVNKWKMSLPFYLFSGFQRRGHNDKDIDYNGCVQVDIDYKVKGGDKIAETIKNELSKLPYVLMAGISPSGVGVKALVRTNNLSKGTHIEALSQVYKDICSKTSASVENCDNVGASQPVFAFFDKDLYVNREAAIFECSVFDGSTLKKKKRTKKSTAKKVTKSVKVDGKEVEVSFVDCSESVGLNKEQVEKCLDIAFSAAKRKHGDRLSFPMVRSAAATSNNFGVGTDDFIEAAENRNGGKLNDKKYAMIQDMYNRYSRDFGTIDISHEVETVSKEAVVVEYSLQEGEKLSSIDLDLSENSLVWSPTGSGKSYYIGNKLTMDRIMVVPTKSLVLQFAKQYGASMFFQECKEIKNTNFIVTTYSSLENLSFKIDTSKYVLFVDEGHNTTSSASEGYLLKPLNKVVDLCKSFKAYHFLTATPLFSFSPIINELKVLKVTRPVGYTKNVKQLVYSDLYKTMANAASRSKKAGAQFAILSNTTKDTGKLGKFKHVLGEFKYVAINSTMKLEDSYIKVAIDGDMRGIDGIISTSILKEGNSITNHTETINIFIDGGFHPSDIEQFCARFRNAKVVNLYLLKFVDTESGATFFNMGQAKDEILKVVDAAKVYMEALGECEHLVKTQLQMMSMVGKGFFRTTGGIIKVDDLAISNKLFVEERGAANLDYTYMVKYLSNFGWIDRGIGKSYDTMTSKAKKRMDIKSNAAKEKHAQLIESTLEKIVLDTPNENSIKVEDREGDIIECDLRYKVGLISHYLDDKDSLVAASEYLKELGFTKQKWGGLSKAITIQKIKQNMDKFSLKSAPSVFVDKMYKSFEVGSSYSSDEVMEKVNIVLKDVFDSEVNKNKASVLFKTFFSVTRKKRNVEGSNKRINVSCIVSDNATGFDLKVKNVETVFVKENYVEFDDVYWLAGLK